MAKRKYMSKGPKSNLTETTTPKAREATFTMSVGVPSGGLVIKLKGTNNRALGTLYVESEGIRFTKVKAKKQADRLLTWAILQKIMELGLTG